MSGTLVRTTRPGDVLFLAPPQGDFVLPEHPRPLLMVTAGSGITPVMSMIRTLVPRRPDADVVLVHSARTPGDSLFREELAELADQFPNFRLAHWFTGEQGRMDLVQHRPAGRDLPRLEGTRRLRLRPGQLPGRRRGPLEPRGRSPPRRPAPTLRWPAAPATS